MSDLSFQDRFSIFEQQHLHQRCVDGDPSLQSAKKYIDLYWPEARFTVKDIRDVTFEGADGLKRLFDYAHSVFPLEKWSHSLGAFVIEGDVDGASLEWRWIVSWKAEQTGTVSTGTYRDRFEKWNGIWKCLERVSNVDPNWPAALLQSYANRESDAFKAS